MKKLLSFIAAMAFAATASADELLLDYRGSTDIPISSNTAYHEVLWERVEFTTTQPNEVVYISVSIPFSVHAAINAQTNGAIRVYLDGDAFVPVSFASMWNGEVLINSGGWTQLANLPASSQVGGVIRRVIETPGVHTIRTMFSGSSTITVGTMRTVRRIQVWKP